jgi:Protein of unknown function (DUF2442)
MLKDIVMVQPCEHYQLLLRFEDGVEGMVDLAQLIKFSGIFSPLKGQSYFAQVQINPESGTIIWENGADLDPDVLYSIVTGQPIPDYSNTSIAS